MENPPSNTPLSAQELQSQNLAIAGVLPSARCLAAGTALFRQGDKVFGIFRLVSGRLRLVRVTPHGAEAPMHTVHPGELFAEPSLFSKTYHCDAIAIQRSDVLVYPKTMLLPALRQNQDALWTFTSELAKRVQDLRTNVELRRIRSASERVLQALRLRCNTAGEWQMDSTLKQFAEEIGLTHEALYRAMATLERNGSITKGDDRIRLEPLPSTHHIKQ